MLMVELGSATPRPFVFRPTVIRKKLDRVALGPTEAEVPLCVLFTEAPRPPTLTRPEMEYVHAVGKVVFRTLPTPSPTLIHSLGYCTRDHSTVWSRFG